MGWVLKIPHRLRDVCEFGIMLKVLHHLKLFHRNFFDNEYKVSRLSILGLEGIRKKKGEFLFCFANKIAGFKPFQTEMYFAYFLSV
jgi:hypothetical protein